jgi:uncharacterized protein (UPF0332 family)
MRANPHTRTGCKTQFGLNFVKTGLVTIERARLYADLMDWRQKGDYGNIFDFDRESVEPLFEPVERFLIANGKLINKDNTFKNSGN